MQTNPKEPAAKAEVSDKKTSPVPTISLPKGGGAIRGMGEKFGANPVTGTGSMTVPIATSPGRSGFGPQLSVSYDSGAGNGPFGLGWSLSLPAITRKTDKGLPRYNDAEESDVFILSGAEDLVPVLVENARGKWVPEDLPSRKVNNIDYRIQRYRPRIEGLFARIERWTNIDDAKDVFWRSISKDNITTWYGKTDESRIADPADPTRIFSWLICQSHDDKGNVIVYGYKPEDSKLKAGLGFAQAHERNRTERSRSAQRYLKRIRYGNHSPYLPELKAAGPWPEPPGVSLDDGSKNWFFEVIFDYGEHLASAPKPNDAGAWDRRNDPFSSYRAGFEVRTYRLCQRVLMFHHFLGEPDVRVNCLVRSTDFTYSSEKNPADTRNPIFSSLLSVTQAGYKRKTLPETGYLKRSLPPVEFTYTEAIIQGEVRDVDPASLENLPSGLDGSAYQWVDLDGEGLSGILTEQGSGWFYKRNLSPINVVGDNGSAHIEARFAPVELVAAKPTSGLAAGHAQFMDLAGDGQPDLVTFRGPTPGFYERTPDAGSWEPFTPFASLPVLDWDDPNLKFVDLTGDGHADLLITEDEAFRWHPSLAEDGFGPSEHVRQSRDEETGPRLVFADGTQSIYLADMSGDGLSDLVRIGNGAVCYWPNLGYGRFGAKVTMDNSPCFDFPDQFDQKRIRLADVDGSGLTDILYLHGDGVRIYFNQSGNSWSQPPTAPAFPRIDSHTSVTVVDLLGNGTACLVWSSALPGDAGRQMRYIDLMGGQKPHLLVKMVNNLGAETVVSYAPSTKFYLQDQRAGKPWITKLPFPVHVVERVETLDRISGNRFVTRHAFHHGYFDGEEREFRGFGMVEQWDTEEFAALSATGSLARIGGERATNIDPASHVPPILTRTWFHTGAYLGRDRVSNYFAGLLDGTDTGEYYREPAWRHDDTEARKRLLDDTVLPAELSLDEEREACRAPKGAMLRQEVYALDGTPKAEHPYTITEQNFTIERLQPRDDNRHAVFFTHPREAISYHYERNPADPRVQHALTLEVDRFGNVLKEAAIGYGRRQPDPSLPLQVDRDKQTKTLITYTENRVTKPIEDVAVFPDAFRNPLPCEVRTFELTGYVPTGSAGRFQPSDFVNPDPNTAGRLRHVFLKEFAYEETATGNKRRRPIEWVRTLYRKDDLTGLLPLGQLAPLGLPGESYKLAFTPGLLDVYASKIAPAALRTLLKSNDGHYVDLDTDGHWWIPSGRMFFSPVIPNPQQIEPTTTEAAQELAEAQRHFFLPRRYRDPFLSNTVVDYDAYDLLATRSSDALGNTISATNDYRVLQPRLVTDPNRNRAAVAFDALGMVVGTAVMGKPLPAPVEGDSLENFKADLTEAVVLDHLADPFANPKTILRRATTRLVYDLFAYHRTKDQPDPQPAVVYTLARETHDSDPVPAGGLKIQHSFSYSDGFGREIQKKIQAEAGDAPRRKANVLLPTGDIRPGDLVRDAQGKLVPPTNAPRRWVGTGRTVFNNKGKPVRQYEPFFSATHLYEEEREMTDTGVSPVLFYDPVERVVATLHPNHTWEKVVFDPWQQTTYDVNDTVLNADGTTNPKLDRDVAGFFSRLPNASYLPTWYEKRMALAVNNPERVAAKRAAIHRQTSTVAQLDTLGRTILTIAHNRFERNGAMVEEKYPTRVLLDIEGNQRAVIDAKDRVVMRYNYDMLGNRIHQASMEAGERWMLNDVAGKPIRAWDSRNHEFSHKYDPLRRPTETRVKGGDGIAPLDNVHEKRIYGEGQSLNGKTDQELNLRGKPFAHYDTAGKVQFEEYDFKGNLLRSSRRLLQDYKKHVNWARVPAPQLENETFTSRTTYDALNRPLTATSPDGSTYRPAFNEANLLDKVDVNLRGKKKANGELKWTAFVTNINYNAKGQRELIAFGNGAETTYKYDPLTFRLTKLTTTRPAGLNGFASKLFTDPTVVQDLRYTYDPAGNLTRIADAALKTIFYNNEQVEPVCEYTYDALYRLIEAKGREHIGQTAFEFNPPSGNRRDYPFTGLNDFMAHPNDLQTLRNYTQRYEYDAVGNFEMLRHIANGGSWKRGYKYEEDSLIENGKKSNRLTRTTVRNGLNHTGTYTYTDAQGNDVNGCMTAINSMKMVWNFKDQLQQVDLGGGGIAYYVYDAAGQRARKVIETRNGTRKQERIYLGGFEIYRDYDASGTTVTLERETLHVMDDKQRIALAETQTNPNSNPVNAPVPVQRYQFGNHLGSASLELDDHAKIISYEEYTPYGSTSYQAVRSGTEAPKRYRYTGKERDSESGLYYHGARYYAPWLARWISADPADITTGVNRFTYVGNNPLCYKDPDGRKEQGWWETRIGGIHAANQSIHEASVQIGNKIVDAGEASIEQAGIKNEFLQSAIRLQHALEATVVSTAIEVGAGVLMAGPNILAGLDAGGNELGEGLGRVGYGESADERIIGGLQILSGLGKGAEVTLQVVTMKRSWGSGTIKKAGQSPTVSENKAHGDAFRDKVVDARSTPWRESTNEVRIRPNVGPGKPGTKKDDFIIDTLERSKITGKYKLVEAKGTSTARLTKKQRPGFENFEKYGGRVVGTGKIIAPGGTQLPPSGIKVTRPLGLFVETSVPAAVLQTTQERARLDNQASSAAPVSAAAPQGTSQTTINTDLDNKDVTIYHPNFVH